MISIGDAANSYFLAAQRCEERQRVSQNQIQFLLVPAVTNRAFSIELFLKAILQSDSSLERGHDINQLFEELGEDRKRQIIEGTGMEEGIFHAELEKNANLFVEWRYLFEKEDIQITWQFVQKFSDSVKNVYESHVKND